MASNPGLWVTGGFALATGLGTGLLMLPQATRAPGSASLMEAAFTTVSAVCVTGLITVDTATYWSPFGQAVILGLIQIGGVGVMTLATLLVLAVRGRLRLRARRAAQAETHALQPGEVRQVARRVVATSLLVEAAVALALAVRFRIAYDDSWASALWHGAFHSVSAFNNAGFALWSTGLMPVVSDLWLIGPITLAVVLGGLGFPVIAEVLVHARRARRRRRLGLPGDTPLEVGADGAIPGERSLALSRAPGHWSMHTRLTLWGTVGLLVLGTAAFALFEWRNAGTLGGLPVGDKVLASWANGGVFPRTAGFNSIDYAQIRPETEAVTTGLMFIGGGSAGTAGGLKITTLLLLWCVMVAEIRGDEEVLIGGRRVGPAVVRQALAIALLAVGLVALATLAILMLTQFSFDQVLFEVVSAFATVGLSLGITPSMPVGAQLILMTLMFLGRVGPITVASALAVRTRRRLVHHPEERPIVG